MLLSTKGNPAKAEYMRIRWKKDFKEDDVAFQLNFIDKYHYTPLGDYMSIRGERVDVTPVITKQLLDTYFELFE